MDKMAELLKGLAQKAGTAVDQLGPHVVRHTEVDAWVKTGICVLVMLCCWAGGLLVPAYVAKHDMGSDDDQNVVRLVCPIVAAIMSVIMISQMGAYLPAAIEPIGATLKALVGA